MKRVIDIVEDIKNGGDPYKPVEESLEKIKKLDPKYNIFITIIGDIPERIEERKGKLPGIPIAIKDNIVIKNIRTTCASRVLENFIPGYTATVVKKIEKEVALIIGKTNMDEFAMGALGTTSAFGPTLNPLDPRLSPGGSSSGSAVAVASGIVPLALGSDTGGSIRLPAAWTGVYGLKPSYGTVSRYGLVSYADSLEQIGPFATNASDLAYFHSIITGYDDRDPTSQYYQTPPEMYEKIAWKEPDPSILKNLKIAVIKEFLEHPMADENVIKIFWINIKKIESEGAEINEVSEPLLLKTPQVYYIIAFSEASSNLARYDGVRYGSRAVPIEDIDWDTAYMVNRSLFGWEVKRRIMLGSFILSKGYYDMYFSRALKARNKIKKTIDKILKENSVIASPGTPITPLPIEYDATDLSKLNAVDAPLMIANLTGYPALTMPFGKLGSSKNTLQFTGPMWSDDFLLLMAKALEEVAGQ